MSVVIIRLAVLCITSSCLALQATAADPAMFSSRKAAAGELLRNHRYQEALAEATAINRDWPDDQETYRLLAAAHLALGNYDAAESAIQWMLDLRIGKSDAEGWMLVARFRETTGDLDGAMDAARSAFTRTQPAQEKERRAVTAYSARLQFLAGQTENAEQVLRDLNVLPGDAEALETLAQIRVKQGRRPEAIEILRKLWASTADPKHLYRLAEATGDRDLYVKFENATRNEPNRELVLYYAVKGARPAEALTLARRAAERQRDVYTLDALAVALWANGKQTEARATMDSVLKVGTKDPEIAKHAAQFKETHTRR